MATSLIHLNLELPRAVIGEYSQVCLGAPLFLGDLGQISGSTLPYPLETT